MQAYEVAKLQHFRNSWVLERKQRPDIVVITGQRMPYPSTPEPERSQYYNLFFRPWTLFVGSAIVPHIRLLSLERGALEQQYAAEYHGSTALPNEDAPKQSWKAAWENYVRGNVVSVAAAQLIAGILRETSYGREVDTEEGQEEEVRKTHTQSVPHLNVPPALFQEELVNGELQAKKKTTKQDVSYMRSNNISTSLWVTPPENIDAEARMEAGDMFAESYDAHLAAARIKPRKKDTTTYPLRPEQEPAATFSKDPDRSLQRTLDAILQGHSTYTPDAGAPTAQQTMFLKHFVARLRLEVRERRTDQINVTNAEPLLDCVHGLPGTGMSM